MRIRIRPAVTAELAARYRERDAAETKLVLYLRGVVDTLGIPVEAVEGFDDATGELLLTDGTVIPKLRR